MSIMYILFFLSATLLTYIYIGYPAVIFLLSKLRGQENVTGSYQPSVSIIIVAYNEEARIAQKIDNCLSLNYPLDKLEIVIVSDGSTDDTHNIVEAYASRNVKLIKNTLQRGKSACLNDGVNAANGDYLVFCDTRQQVDLEAVNALMAHFIDDDVGAVSGEMFYQSDSIEGHAEGMDFYWRYEKFIRKSESDYRSVIGVTGALYAIDKRYYKAIPEGVVLDDVMIPMQVILQGKKVLYSSKAKIYDIASTDLHAEEKRKRRTISGNYQVLKLMPWLLSISKNRLWFEYFSHKVLRLMSPFLLILFLMVSFLLAKVSWVYLLGFLGGLYLCLASLIGICNEKLSSKIYIKVPLGFMSMNYFAFMGSYDFFSGKKLGSWKK